LSHSDANATGIAASLLSHAIIVALGFAITQQQPARLVANAADQAETFSISLAAFNASVSPPAPPPAATPKSAINPEKPPEKEHTSSSQPKLSPTIKPASKPQADIAHERSEPAPQSLTKRNESKTDLSTIEPLPSINKPPDKQKTEEIITTAMEQPTAITSAEPSPMATSKATTKATTKASSTVVINERTASNAENSTNTAQEADYAQGVRLAVLAQRTYPQRARRKKLTGTVVVTFRVFADGALDFTTVSKSSGHKLLDRAAMNAVKRVRKFKPFPDELHRQFWDFEVPVVFQ